MTKRLSALNIDNIVLEIGNMRGKVTWDTVEKKVNDKLGLDHTSWALRKVPEIVAAYRNKKESNRKQKEEIKATKSENTAPKNAAEIIADLELKNSRLMERIEIILRNAVKLSVPVKDMEMPINPISYRPKKGS